MWVLTVVTTALTAQTDTAPMSAQDSTALQVKRTTVWAACLPGAGQIRNRQIWKVPVVWGGMGYAAWATWDNAREMRASIDDLIALTDDDPTTQTVLTDENGNAYSEGQLEDRAFFYRRNRDLSILSFLIAHGLQVLDANTGAMLRNLVSRFRCHAPQPGHLGRTHAPRGYDVGGCHRSHHVEFQSP